MQTPTFLELFILACKGDYTPKTVPADTEPPHGFEPVGAASATALALYGLALDLSAQIDEARQATRKSGGNLRKLGRLADLAPTVSAIMHEGSGREAEADRLSANLALTLRTLQLLLFAEHPSLYRRDPDSFVLEDNGQEPGVRIVNRLVYAGPEDESYAALPEGHPAAKIGLSLVRAVAGEDRHDELGLPDTLHPFNQQLFGVQAATDEVSPAVAAIRDEPWVRRVAAAIAVLETAPVAGEVTLRSEESVRLLVSAVRHLGALAAQVFFGLAAERYELDRDTAFVLREDWTLARAANQDSPLKLPVGVRAFTRIVSGALFGKRPPRGTDGQTEA